MTHYDIFNYWKDKAINSKGEIEINYGYKGNNEEWLNHNTVPVVHDWGECRCFACDIDFYEEDVSDYKDDLKLLWNAKKYGSKLEMAHIIPRKLGGEMTAKNLFLLCKRCHRDSPDCAFPSEFFRWVYKRKKDGDIANRTVKYILKETSKRGIQLNTISNTFDLDTLLQVAIGQHSGWVVEASFQAAIMGILEKLNQKNAFEQLRIYLDAVKQKRTKTKTDKEFEITAKYLLDLYENERRKET